MKKVPYRDQISKFLGLSLIIFLLFSTSLFSQDAAVEQQAETAEASAEEVVSTGGDAAKGKQLFNQNCAACHALNRKMTGPALANVETRLAEDEGLDKEWLYTWIKNSPGHDKFRR